MSNLILGTQHQKKYTAAALSLLLVLVAFQIMSLVNPPVWSTVYRITYRFEFKTTIFPFYGMDYVLSIILSIAVIFRTTVTPKHWPADLAIIMGILITYAVVLATSTADLSQNDLGLQLASLIMSAGTLILLVSRFRSRIDWQLVAYGLVIIVVIIECFSIGKWIANQFSPTPVYTRVVPSFPAEVLPDIDWKASELSMKIFYGVGIATPLLVMLIAFSYAIRSLLYYLSDTLKSKFTKLVALLLTDSQLERDERSYSNKEFLLIAAGFILSVVLPVASYTHVNDHLLGVDIRQYNDWIGMIEQDSSTPADLVDNAFRQTEGDRPLTYLAIISITKLASIDLLTVLKYLPVILGPLLAASTWFSMRIMFSNRRLESLAVSVTPLATQTIVGIYAAFYGNWFSLILGFVLVAFVYKIWTRPSPYSFAVAMVALVAMLLFHSYTWTYFILFLSGFILLSFLVKLRNKIADPHFPKKIAMLIIIIAVSIAVDVAKASTFSTPMAFFASSDKIEGVESRTSAGLEEFGSRWANLAYLFNIYLGGYLNLSFLFLPLLLWSIKADHNSIANRLLLSMIYISSIPIIFSNAPLQSRLFYDIPFHIPILLYLLSLKTKYRYLIILLVGLTFLDYSLRAISNFNFIILT